MNGLRNRTANKAIAVTIGVLALIAGAGVGSASAVATVSQTGSVGRLLSSGRAVCYEVGGYSNTVLTAPKTTVGRAPTYASSVQTIWEINRVEYWTGTQWLTYRWGQWRNSATSPNQTVAFAPEDLPISQADLQNGFRTYRVATLYYWQVGQSTIGQVTNYYEAKDYTIAFANVSMAPSTGNTPPGQSSWCVFPTLQVVIG
jgi:hypothetical protein